MCLAQARSLLMAQLICRKMLMILIGRVDWYALINTPSPTSVDERVSNVLATIGNSKENSKCVYKPTQSSRVWKFSIGPRHQCWNCIRISKWFHLKKWVTDPHWHTTHNLRIRCYSQIVRGFSSFRLCRWFALVTSSRTKCATWKKLHLFIQRKDT